jgi:uncharacterized membrane protein
MPFLFGGTLALILAPLYFFSDRFPTRKKVGYAAILLILAASFNFSLLDILWHGMQRPNWLNSRFAYMFVALLIVLTAEVLENLRHFDRRTLLSTVVFWCAMLVILQKMDYDFLHDFIVIWGGIFLLLFLPAYYSFRMTVFCIADNPRQGAFASLRKSKFLLRGNRFALFRLDLSLWWFYALQFLISALCYGDSIAILLGISLPWSPEFGFYFFFVLALIVQILVYYFLMNRVNVAYAVAFDILNDRFEEQLETARKAREEFTCRQPPFSTDY